MVSLMPSAGLRVGEVGGTLYRVDLTVPEVTQGVHSPSGAGQGAERTARPSAASARQTLLACLQADSSAPNHTSLFRHRLNCSRGRAAGAPVPPSGRLDCARGDAAGAPVPPSGRLEWSRGDAAGAPVPPSGRLDCARGDAAGAPVPPSGRLEWSRGGAAGASLPPPGRLEWSRGDAAARPYRHLVAWTVCVGALRARPYCHLAALTCHPFPRSTLNALAASQFLISMLPVRCVL